MEQEAVVAIGQVDEEGVVDAEAGGGVVDRRGEEVAEAHVEGGVSRDGLRVGSQRLPSPELGAVRKAEGASTERKLWWEIAKSQEGAGWMQLNRSVLMFDGKWR